MDNPLATTHDIERLRLDIHEVRRDTKETENKIRLKLGSIIVATVSVLGIILSIINKIH